MSEEEKIEQENNEQTIAQPTKEELDTIMKDVSINKDDINLEASSLSEQEIEKSEKEREVIDEETLKLYEEFGDFLQVKAEITPDEGIKRVIPTGIDVLDAALGGGLPVGAFTIIAGDPGSGKSMLAMQCIAAGQRKYKGLLASFLDSEEATTTKRLYNLGVRYPPIKPYNDITIESLFKHIETMCVFKEEKKINENPSIIVWDSIANTLSQKERETEDVNSVIGYKARVLSLLTPKYVAKCAKYNIAWISVNQLRDQLNMGPFSAPKTLRFLSTGKSIPGGNTILFNAFTLLEMKARQELDPDKYGFAGIMSTCTTVKNKLMAPNITVELIGNFQTGFSNFRTSYHFLAKHKYMQTGAWNYVKCAPEIKVRTKDAETRYNEDENFRKAFDDTVKECIQNEIIDKYDPEIK